MARKQVKLHRHSEGSFNRSQSKKDPRLYCTNDYCYGGLVITYNHCSFCWFVSSLFSSSVKCQFAILIYL